MDDVAKEAARGSSPGREWRRVLPRKAAFGLARLISYSIGRLPSSVALDVKRRMRLTGRLDYPRHEIRMYLDSAIQISRLHACRKEPETVEWIETRFRPGCVFYDIGANVGAYSLVASAVAGEDCRIYAFEPSFSSFAALCQNVILNRCEAMIVPLPVALVDRTSLLAFFYSTLEPGAALHSIGEAGPDHELRNEPDSSLSVLSFRLDDLIGHLGLHPPTHVKLDVDGAELSVLRGAEGALAKPSLRSLLVEADEARHATRDILALMAAKGFRLVSKHPRGKPTVFNYIFDRGRSRCE